MSTLITKHKKSGDVLTQKTKYSFVKALLPKHKNIEGAEK